MAKNWIVNLYRMLSSVIAARFIGLALAGIVVMVGMSGGLTLQPTGIALALHADAPPLHTRMLAVEARVRVSLPHPRHRPHPRPRRTRPTRRPRRESP